MKPFPAIIFGLLGTNAAIVAVTVYLAHSDPSFAVEPDYYQKALKWDQAVQERTRSRALGWTAQIELGGTGVTGRHVRLMLRDQAGKAVAGAQVRVTAFSALRAADRWTAEGREVEPGAYAFDLPIGRAGRWEFDLRATRGESSFSELRALDVPEVRP
jgi:nitrogen fixation protein FixH